MSNQLMERPGVVAFNPAAGSFDKEKFTTFIDNLKNLLSEVTVVETHPSYQKTSIAVVEAVAEAEGSAASDKGSAIVIPDGGDGTIWAVVAGATELGITNSFAFSKERGTKKNGPRAINSVFSTSQALKYGVEVQVPLLKTSWISPDGEEHIIRSVGDNAMHAAVSVLERVVERKPLTSQMGKFRRETDEVLTTVDTLADHDEFIALFSDGRVRKIASFAVFNIPNFAGRGRTHVPANADYFRMMAVPQEGKVRTLLRLSGLATGLCFGEKYSDQLQFKIFTKDRSPVKLQVDGEYEKNGERLLVAHGSDMTIALDWEHSYTAFTTSLSMIRHAATRKRALSRRCAGAINAK